MVYANFNPSFTLALLGVTVVTFFGAQSFDRKKSHKEKLLAAFIVLSLLPLFIFKYYNFINESLFQILDRCGLRVCLPGLNWAIPIGISFFSLQAVGYMLDVYRGKCQKENNFIDYALFVGFFPQIASGPISTASELLPQIKNERTFSYGQGKECVEYLVWGLFLKAGVADRIGLYVDTVFNNFEYCSSLNCIVSAFLYSIQIYADFAGYSLLAVGFGGLLGFNLINNFERPYFAASVTEFWRRWHISLTRWLTTNIYIPLGGNRCSKVKQYFNILVTFLVSGLWHGANWTYVIWGSIHGVLQVVEKSLMGGMLKNELKTRNSHLSFARAIRTLLTFIVVSVAWVFFRMPTLTDCFGFFSHVFTSSIHQQFLDAASNSDKLCMFLSLIVLFVKDSASEYNLFHRIRHNNIWRFIICLLLAILILSIGILDSGSFIYVSF